MTQRFYRDAKGDLRAEAGRDQLLLGRFLEADVQGSIGICEEVLAALDDIAAGRSQRWQMTGNVHTLILSKRRARIQAEIGRSPDLILSLAEFRRALQEWRALLDKKPPRRSR